MSRIKNEKLPSIDSGYPGISAILESGDDTELRAALQKAREELEAVYRSKRGLKKGREAEVMIAAISRVEALMDELFKIRKQLKK